MHDTYDHDEARCPACGLPDDACRGHGRNADPVMWGILIAHDLGAHTRCHPAGCSHAEGARR